jgi:hypothetical protein
MLDGINTLPAPSILVEYMPKWNGCSSSGWMRFWWGEDVMQPIFESVNDADVQQRSQRRIRAMGVELQLDILVHVGILVQ